ncbi:hypothetical protein Tco_1479522, partial [Tanacetum coccineum]
PNEKVLGLEGPVAYQLDLPEELNGVHDAFHVSNLKKCLADPTLKVPLDEIRVDAKLNFVEEPDPVNTSLHTIDHEIRTRKEKERVVLEREFREREMQEKRKDIS